MQIEISLSRGFDVPKRADGFLNFAINERQHVATRISSRLCSQNSSDEIDDIRFLVLVSTDEVLFEVVLEFAVVIAVETFEAWLYAAFVRQVSQ